MGQLTDFLADLGGVIEESLSSRLVAILVVILAWLHHGLAAAFTTLLVASAYVRLRKGERRSDRGFAAVVGIILVFVGLYWLMYQLAPEVRIGWPTALVLLGALLLALGMVREGRRGIEDGNSWREAGEVR